LFLFPITMLILKMRLSCIYIFHLSVIVSEFYANAISLNESTNFNNEALYAHNKYRTDHGYDGVKLSLDLMKLAHAEASRLAKLDKLDVGNVEYNNQNLSINRAILKGVNYFSGKFKRNRFFVLKEEG
jgi:hypothetical protein